MELLLNHAPCAVLRLTDSGVVLEANATLCSWLGYLPGALDDAHIDEILAPGSNLLFSTHVHPAIRLNGVIEGVRLNLLSASGQRCPVLLAASRRDDLDEPYVVVVALREA